MKGTNLPTALISVLVGAILIFAVVVPVAYNGIYGTAYSEVLANSTANTTPTVTYYNTTCKPLSLDGTWITGTNTAGQDITALLSLDYATGGGVKLTALADGVVNETGTITINSRCLDAGYISNGTTRGIASVIPTLVVVLLLVSLAGMMYMKQN